MVDEYYLSMCRFVRKERERRGLSRERLALECGIGKNTLTNLEQGRNVMTRELLKVVLHLWDDIGYFGEDLREDED